MFKKLCFVQLAILVVFCAGCATNPVTGETQFQLFGSGYEQDVRLGLSAAPEIEKELGGPIENSLLQNYINSVGQRIALVSHAPELEYHFSALEDKTVNAFALPGGWVYITSGMLKGLKSEAQLASIFSHEIVHITARHATVQMSQQIGLEIVLSTVASEAGSPGVVQAASIGVQLVGLKFSRDDEGQADMIGLDYMVEAGYDPYGMVETMQMLTEQDSVRPVEFFSTHPSPENRREMILLKIQSRYPARKLERGEEDYRRYVLSHLD